MSVQYKFTNLNSLADYFGNRAAQARQNSERYSAKQIRGVEYRAEASALESVADMIRNTTLTGDVSE